MFVYGQITVGDESQRNKLPNYIQVVPYLLIVVYLCVNYVDSMSPLLPAITIYAILGIAPVKKVKIVQSVRLERNTQSLIIL